MNIISEKTLLYAYVPGTIGSSDGMYSTVIGHLAPLPRSRLPNPITIAAQNDAVAMSMSAKFMREYLRACPHAARRAILAKALLGGFDMAPNPIAAIAARSPSVRIVARCVVITGCF